MWDGKPGSSSDIGQSAEMNTYTDYDRLRKSSIERDIQSKMNENGHKNTKNGITL
jgi:hypothetical protein